LTYWSSCIRPIDHFEVEVVNEINRLVPELGLELSSDEIVELDRALTQRLKDKSRWQDPEKRKKMQAQRSSRKGKKSQGPTGYVSQGSAAGLVEAVEKALRDERAGPETGLRDFYTAGVTDSDVSAVALAVTEADRSAEDVDRTKYDSEADLEEEYAHFLAHASEYQLDSRTYLYKKNSVLIYGPGGVKVRPSMLLMDNYY